MDGQWVTIIDGLDLNLAQVFPGGNRRTRIIRNEEGERFRLNATLAAWFGRGPTGRLGAFWYSSVGNGR